MGISHKTKLEDARDQSFHFWWCFANVRCLKSGDPFLVIVGLVSFCYIVYREIKQWPPAENRPFDPYLDGAFYILGTISGTLY